MNAAAQQIGCSYTLNPPDGADLHVVDGGVRTKVNSVVIYPGDAINTTLSAEGRLLIDVVRQQVDTAIVLRQFLEGCADAAPGSKLVMVMSTHVVDVDDFFVDPEHNVIALYAKGSKRRDGMLPHPSRPQNEHPGMTYWKDDPPVIDTGSQSVVVPPEILGGLGVAPEVQNVQCRKCGGSPSTETGRIVHTFGCPDKNKV